MAMIWRHNGSAYGREVRNLNWLLRHAGEVHTIHVVKYNDGVTSSAALMVAELRDHVYATSFASWDVCLHWIDRPSFDGVLVRVTTDRLKALPGPIDRHGQRYRIEGDHVVTRDGHQLREDARPTHPERSRDRVQSIIARRTVLPRAEG